MKKTSLLTLLPFFIIYVVIFRFIYLENGLAAIVKICIPILLGIFLAIILNPILIFLQFKLKISNRYFAILITYAIFFGLISLIITVVTPDIIKSISQLLKDLPKLFSAFNNLIFKLNEKYKMIRNETLYQILENYMSVYAQKLSLLLSAFLNAAVGRVITTFEAVFNFILSVIISVYILVDKENFENWFYKLCFSIFEKKHAKEIINVIYSLNINITRFISGKLLDSLIVGIIAYCGSRYIINAPYPILDGVIIGTTNIIPYFGAFLGGIPSTLIVLLYNPYKGFLMGIFIIILQQIDGLFIGPKIIGVQLSIKPIAIIISIIIGGGLFGIAGMLLATPIAALIITSIDTYMKYKLKDNNIVLPHNE